MQVTNKNLPQLYRFCFLMMGEPGKAEEVFHATVREAALRAAHGEPPPDRLWFFRDARWRCLAASDLELQAEPFPMEEQEISSFAPQQIKGLNAKQLALWISSAPDPQRTALALFYLDEFLHAELMSLLEIKVGELADLISSGRRQFQAWLDSVSPREEG